MPTWQLPVRITYPGSGGPGFNIWHVRTTDEEGQPPFTELPGLSNMIHEFYTNLRPVFTPATSIAFEGVITKVTDPADQETNAPAWTVTGQAGDGIMLPSAAQIVVGWRTESAARSAVGRTFVGPLSRGSLDPASDGTPTQGTVNLLRDSATALIASSTGFTNGAVGVYSRNFGLFHDFTAARVRKTYAVLTSRRD